MRWVLGGVLLTCMVSTAVHAAPAPLRVGVDATFYPFEFTDNGVKRGFDVDLLTAVAQHLGRPVVWIDLDFKGLIPGLVAGRFDVVASGLYDTAERRKIVDFSEPYYPGGLVVMARSDSTLTDPTQLAGKRVAVQTGTKSVTFVQEQFPTAALVEVEKNADMVAQVEARRADVLITALPTAQAYVQKRPDLKIVLPQLTAEQYAFAVRKDSPALRQQINTALAAVRASGQYDTLVQRWFTQRPDVLAPSSAWETVRAGLPALMHGTWITLQVTSGALGLSVVLGLLVGIARNNPRRRVLYKLSSLYVGWVRGTPLLVQLFILFFGLPQLGVSIPAFGCAILGLGLYSGSYVSEIVRGALQSVDQGQAEAAQVLGLSSRQTLRYVILPQAVLRMMAPLGNETVALIKNSALASLLTIDDVMREGQRLISVSFQSLTIYLAVGAIYMLLTSSVSWLLRSIERRLRRGGLLS